MKKYLAAEDIQLVFSGKNYFELLEQIIDESKETLHLQTYIFETDETGLKVIESLKKAASRGVKIFVLTDAYGSFPFKKEIRKDLSRCGINFRLYSPLFSSESVYFGRRLHHKIVVADKKVAIIGGINIANKYNFIGNEEAWLDYGALVKGEVCEYLDLLCEAVFKKKRRSKLFAWENKIHSDIHTKQHGLIRFRRNDFIKQQNEIHQSYKQSITRAENSITIVASYFLPGNNFRRLLRLAAARGVRIRIILAGKSDVSSVKLAQTYLYGFYLTNNIELFEWQNSVLHGKAMMVDNTWVTVGSYNLNFLSHYISIELNADIIDKDFVQDFSTHIETILEKSCTVVDLEKSAKQMGYFSKLKMKLAYIFHRTIMNIVMMGRKHKKENSNMDSLTHTVLGACLGEVIAGKKIGKKAMLIGALANNFPDIDVATSLWTSPVNELLVHRGITHSILFALIATPLFALAFKRLLKNNELSSKGWLLLIGSGLFLHILMDAFTSYGTGWFEPFNHHRVSFNTLFIIDPFFAIPLIICSIILLILKRTYYPGRTKVAATGLILGMLYLIATIFIKLHVNSVIEKDLSSKNLVHQSYMATPTPMNNILWYSVVKSNNNFYVGYYSIFDKSSSIHWEYFLKKDSLLKNLKDSSEVQALKRFSKNYYSISKRDSILVFSDMRFGQLGGWYVPQAPFVFNFELEVKNNNRLTIQQGRFKSVNSKDFELLVDRIKGN